MRLVIIFAVVACLLAANVAAEVKGVQINVKLINQNPDPVEPGDDVELRFRVDNNISRTVEDVEVELLPKHPFSIKEAAVKNIGGLDASQKGVDAVVVKYRVFVDSDGDEGEHDIYIRYRIGAGGWAREGPFKVSVEAAEAILGVASTSAGNFSAGSAGELELLLKNFGKSLVKDVRASIDLSGVPFYPVTASNEKLISSISPGGSASATFRLVADADADSGYYNTNVRLDYLDDSGNKHLRNSTISLLVYDEPEFVLALKESKVSTPGSNGEIVLSVSNTGPAEIRFMNVELVGTNDYRVLSYPSVYLGNLEADDFETAEFDIRAAKIKPQNIGLKVRLTYKDAVNREMVKDEVVMLPLYSGSDAKRFGLLVASQNLTLAFAKIAVQIIVAVFVLFMLVDCKKNRLPKYKKALWTVLILTGIGAVLYYFIARRK